MLENRGNVRCDATECVADIPPGDNPMTNIAQRFRLKLPNGLVALAVAASALLLAGPGCATRQLVDGDSAKSAAGRGGETYSVSILGDVHYDAPPRERFHASGRAVHFKNNVVMWEKDIPEILSASASLVGPDTAFALQLGDLIDGAGDFNSHTQMLAAATAVLEKTYPGLPVISVCGNHDIIGGWRRGYNSFMLPWLRRQVAPLTTNAVTSTTFGFRHGPDLWVFVNFNDAEATVPIVEKLLADNPDVRYTFVAIHGPVLPMDLFRFRWFYLGEEKYNEARRKVRALLAKRNAIVLAGHVHMLEYKEWEGDGGRITEMVVNSVARWGDGENVVPAVPRVKSETPDDYGAWLKKARLSDDEAKFNAMFEEYRPGLKARYGASAAGHCVLRVSDSNVALEYYGHDAREPTKVFMLRPGPATD